MGSAYREDATVQHAIRADLDNRFLVRAGFYRLYGQKIVPSNTLMRFRKLRIAWSAWWGLACLLLIVLWVRNYEGEGIIQFRRVKGTLTELGHLNGKCEISRYGPISCYYLGSYAQEMK